MISICLFYLKKKVNLFQQMTWFNFNCIQFPIKLFALVLSKEFNTKFQLGNKIDFYLLLLENKESLQLYLKNVFWFIFI